MSPELQPMAVQYYYHVSPSASSDQYTALPLEGVLVTDTDVYRTYIRCYNFDTVLYPFLETGTSDRCLIGIIQRLRFSGFSQYYLSFFLYTVSLICMNSPKNLVLWDSSCYHSLFTEWNALFL